MSTTIFYSAKGGQGTTTTAAAFALANAARGRDTVFVSRVDGFAVLGMHEPPEGEAVTVNDHLIVDRLLRPKYLEEGATADVVYDPSLIARGTESDTLPFGRRLLVTSPCFLAVRAALESPIRPDGIVVMMESGRSLTASDIADAVGAPVLATIEDSPTVARAVDAGLLAARLPRQLARSVEHLIEVPVG